MLNLLVRKWILATGIVFLVLLVFTFALQDKAMFIWDIIMNSWFPICQALTPIEWQTKGNILLGLMWFVSGLVVYSIAVSAIFIFISDLVKKVFAK
ncbi:MAG: hypothetical protein HN584_02465 [Akkermansiaceae bacterium]|jgi:hypothetical protein|nr:hypothetical protein [Akkermansiaceae bacterium]